jgi:hypothetical protein
VLAENTTMRFPRRRLATVVRIRRGTVLLTQEGDLEDHVLEGGDEIVLPAGGLAVAWAFTDAAISLREAGPSGSQRQRRWFAIGLASAFIAAGVPARAAESTAAPSAIERMQEPGPEAKALARRAGAWDVVMTLRPAPDAKPIVTTGVVAERSMVGLFLEEIMKPAPGSSTPEFRRISYLTYSKVEGRWQYVSLDTRFPAGIMPAWSFEKEVDGKLTLQFETLGFVGFGSEVEGRMTRSNYVITRDGDDHELARQYWTQADGSGREWLAVEYEYTRRLAGRLDRRRR